MFDCGAILLSKLGTMMSRFFLLSAVLIPFAICAAPTESKTPEAPPTAPTPSAGPRYFEDTLEETHGTIIFSSIVSEKPTHSFLFRTFLYNVCSAILAHSFFVTVTETLCSLSRRTPTKSTTRSPCGESWSRYVRVIFQPCSQRTSSWSRP